MPRCMGFRPCAHAGRLSEAEGAEMKAILIAPGCEAVEIDADFADYRSIQAFTGGLFSCSPLAPNLAVYYHDEGLLIGLPPNVISNGTLLVGNLLVLRVDDEGETVGTTDADLALVRDWLAHSERAGRFEYDVPAPRIFTSLDEMRAAQPMPAAKPTSVDGNPILTA